MAYFLKQSKTKKGIYLQIYFSYRDPETKKPKNRCHQTLGYVSDLMDQGFEDPVAHYKNEVVKLNEKYHHRKETENCRQITDVPSVRCAGYFPCESILKKLNADIHLNRLQASHEMPVLLFEAIRDLTMACLVFPDAQPDTIGQVLPLLLEKTMSEAQVSVCLQAIGNDAAKIQEIFAMTAAETFPDISLPSSLKRIRYTCPVDEASLEERGFAAVRTIADLLIRIFRMTVLENRFKPGQIQKFLSGFLLFPNQNGYINVSASNPVLVFLEEKYRLPLSNYRLSAKQMKRILEKKL